VLLTEHEEEILACFWRGIRRQRLQALTASPLRHQHAL
jgi:hypothetical protein